MRRRQMIATGGLAAGLAVAGCGRPAPHLRMPAQGLMFPGSAGTRSTLRMRFRSPLPPYPATYIWRALPLRQAGYYTAFFWGNDDGLGDLRTFVWTKDGKADTYYGAHPYPQPAPDGNNHRWEISILQRDLLGAPVDYGRWHVQAFRAWAGRLGKHHDFFWDLPHLDDARSVQFIAPVTWGNAMPPVPTLTWGDAPWAPGREVWKGVLTGFQIYDAALSNADILREAESPRSTAIGRQHLWYENLEPTPDDIADHSGRGHHPEWVGDERPTLWRSDHT